MAHRAHHQAVVWAVRLGSDSDQLKLVIKASCGIDITVSPDAARFIRSDSIRSATVAHVKPVPRAVSAAETPTQSGTHWQIDGWGHLQTPSVVDHGCSYMWVLVDEVSDIPYGSSTKSSSQTSVIEFLDRLLACMPCRMATTTV